MRDKKLTDIISFRAGIFFIGLLLCLVVFSVSAKSDISNAEKHISSIVNYISNQCATYNVTNLASETRSLMRIMESVQQLDRDLSYDRRLAEGEIPDETLLQQYADELYLTGVVVLDPDGRVKARYLSDSLGLDDLNEYINREAVLDVAEYPEKNYAARIALPDGSYLDLAAAGRSDHSGVIVAYYHTTKQYIDVYTLSFQSLLDGYNIGSEGIVAVAKGNVIVAANEETLVNNSVDDVAILNGIEQAVGEGIVDVKGADDSRRHYFGMIDRGRDYYVYAYMPESEVFETTPRNMLLALFFYVVLIMLVQILRWKYVQNYHQEQLKQEKIYQEKLVEEAQKAERANAAKTVFLQRMSHDIRTPINGILGVIEIGDHYSSDLEKQAECRSKVRESGKLLLDLVNEVLDMGKLESGEIILEERSFYLPQLLDEVRGSVERSVAERGITIHRGEPEIPHPYLIGSPLHLKRLLMNILSNAVKYNKPNGQIRIKCQEIWCEEDTAWIEFVCADTGIGMSEEFQKHIFEPFTQETSNAHSRYGGTGLGMSIAKSLVDKMDGTIRFDSKKGEGTTFYITIPFRICEAPQTAEPQETHAQISLAGMQILLVEDNELNMEVAEFLLQNAGARLIKAQNGKEALDLFRSSEVGSLDVILMDVMMPIMDGYQASLAIRALPRADARTVPIIAMTANAFVEDRQKAYESGMNEHLAKPLDKEKLLALLAKYRKNTAS